MIRPAAPRRPALAWILLAAALAGGLLWLARPRPRASGPLPQEAYVWQRALGPEVRRAAQGAGDLSRLVFLAAEVDPAAEPPRVARIDLEPVFLRSLGRPVGLALRIGPLYGTFGGRPETAALLLRLAAHLTAEVRAAGVTVAELELDYDCPESKLADYAAWVRQVRRAVAPTPVVITALPSWLGERRAFGELIEAAGGFVLQVHSLERPTGPEAPLVLCDPHAARAAVEEAGSFGRPFRVALPTYGYAAAFDRQGRFLGLAAEGPRLAWPSGTTVKAANADPAAMAELVAGWNRDRPQELAGILWYRLPVLSDRRSWPASTFRAVRQGRAPRPRLEAHLRPVAGDAALVDLFFESSGEASAPLPDAIRVEWDGPAQVLAADGLALYRVQREGPGRLRFQRRAPAEVPPGEERALGWIRFDRPTAARLDLLP